MNAIEFTCWHSSFKYAVSDPAETVDAERERDARESVRHQWEPIKPGTFTGRGKNGHLIVGLTWGEGRGVKRGAEALVPRFSLHDVGGDRKGGGG